MANLFDIFDGILNKISENPLKWDNDAEFHVANIILSETEKNVLDRNYEEFNDNGLKGWNDNNDGSTTFYYEIDEDEEIEDSEDY